MKYLSIVFVAAITLVSCGGGMETACDCINAASEIDMEDSAAVAAFEEANGEVCEALMADTTQDLSACQETIDAMTADVEEAVEEAVEAIEEATADVEAVADSAAAVVDSAVAEVAEEVTE